MANAIAYQCMYVAHSMDRSAKMLTMVNKRISGVAKSQQFGQEKWRAGWQTHGVFLFAILTSKSVDWGTGWRVLVRHREGEEEDKGKLT